MSSYIDNLNEYRIRSMDLIELNHWAQEAKRELEERDREREEQEEQEQARKDNIRMRVAKRLNEEFERRDRRDGRRTTRNYYRSSSTATEEDYDPFWQLKVLNSSKF